MSIDNELRIAVVDDIEKDRVQIAEETDAILSYANISHNIDRYADAESLLDAIRSDKKYNLLLLDVLMDEMDGMALAKELRNQGNNTAIIFISVSQEMACRGYQVDAARYLVKPLDREELKEALMHCYEKLRDEKEILLPTIEGQHRTSFMNIQFVEAYNRGTRFFLEEETVETTLKFSEVETMLPKSMFLTCHRAYIVNLALTKKVCQFEFQMKSGAVVPISRLRYNDVSQIFVVFVTD